MVRSYSQVIPSALPVLNPNAVPFAPPTTPPVSDVQVPVSPAPLIKPASPALADVAPTTPAPAGVVPPNASTPLKSILKVPRSLVRLQDHNNPGLQELLPSSRPVRNRGREGNQE